MRRVIALVMGACILTVMTTAAASVANRSNQPPRVRSDNARIQEVIQFALDRSQSFEDLVVTLDQSDRIVYVEEGVCAVREHRSCLYLTLNGNTLIARINPRQPIRAAAAALAHELYHAAEIARAPEVIDSDTLRELYKRIGEQSCETQSRHGCWETRAAQAFEALVLRQLADGKSSNARQLPE